MDERLGRAYVPGVMRLLLLLSVLLSALSGVGVSARVPGMAQAVAGRSAIEATVAPARQSVRAKLAHALPSLPAVAGASAMPVLDKKSQPLWASRMRE